MLRRSEHSVPPAKPADFEGWLADLEVIADTEGLDLLLLAWTYAPLEACLYLAALPGELERLLARARWADRCAGRGPLWRVC